MMAETSTQSLTRVSLECGIGGLEHGSTGMRGSWPAIPRFKKGVFYGFGKIN